MRKYRDNAHPDHNATIKHGLTLEEAQKHCCDPATHEPGVWFDCYYVEEDWEQRAARFNKLKYVVTVSDACHLMTLGRN